MSAPVPTSGPADNALRWAGGRHALSGQEWDDLFVWGYRAGMSDMHVKTGAPPRVQVHGKLYPCMDRSLSSTEILSCLRYLYGETGPALLKSGQYFNKAHIVSRKVGPGFAVGSDDFDTTSRRHDRYRFRVNGSAIQTRGLDGAEITLRAIEAEPPILAEMDIEPEILAAYRPRNGIVLIGGATGTGKTRLQAGMTRSMIEDPEFNGKILEFAAPIEYEFDNVEGPSSTYTASEIPGNFRTAMEAVVEALRRAPKVIISPECRGREDLDVAMLVAKMGHVVYSTLHTNTVSESIQRVITAFSYEEREERAIGLMVSLRLIVNCILVPTVDGKQMQLREFLVFGPQERKTFLNAPISKWPLIAARMVEQRGQTFQVAANRALAQGLISEKTARFWGDSF